MNGFTRKLALVGLAVGLTIGCTIPAQADDDSRYRKWYKRNYGHDVSWRYRNPYYSTVAPNYGAVAPMPYNPYPYNPYYVSPYASPYPGYVVNPYPRRDGVSTAVRILRSIGM